MGTMRGTAIHIHLVINMSNLSKLLAKGNASFRQGNITDALSAFEKAAREHGDNSEPWINLAAVHGMQGNYTEALHCARKAVELAPKSVQGWVNLANAAQSCGDPVQAVEALWRAYRLPGCPPEVALELGQTLVYLGRWMEAEAPLRDFLTRNPGHRETIMMLSRVLATKREPESAVMVEEFCRRHDHDIHALAHLGAIYLELGRIEDAWRACERAITVSPEAAEALSFKAALLTYDGRYDEAQDVYEQLLRIQPENPQLLINLATVCQQRGNVKAAIAYARSALKIEPRNPAALRTLSMATLNTDLAESRRLMEDAISIAPHDPSLMTLRGRILELEGDKQGAWECVSATLRAGYLEPSAALVAAAVAPDVGKLEETIEMLERLIADGRLSTGDQRTLRFALVKLCDKAKQYDRAFGHAVIANQLKNTRHDNKAFAIEMNRLKTVYSSLGIASLPRSSFRDELPLFIVGMPRSGTSLLEQILSCHSGVYARGETSDVVKIAESIPYYPDGVRNFPREKLDAIAGAYLQRLREMAPGAIRVTDKLPGNYLYLGLISQMFPGARILHCQRDPRDVCLSNYFTEFAAGHTNTYDIESMALTYKAYQELMDHWKQVLPIPILDVCYENLVEDPRYWVEQILTFCGLEWENACLDFHKSKRHVKTASYDQVRRPLYKSSKARWKNYARHLEPVSRILNLTDEK